MFVDESYGWLIQIWCASTWWFWSRAGASGDAFLRIEQHPEDIFIPPRSPKACTLILDSRRQFGSLRFCITIMVNSKTFRITDLISLLFILTFASRQMSFGYIVFAKSIGTFCLLSPLLSF